MLTKIESERESPCAVGNEEAEVCAGVHLMTEMSSVDDGTRAQGRKEVTVE